MKDQVVSDELSAARDRLVRLAERVGHIANRDLLSAARAEQEALACLLEELAPHHLDDITYLIDRCDTLVATLSD